jgi:predicted metalloprotease with PDZ domain
MKTYLPTIVLLTFLFLSCGTSKNVVDDLATNHKILSQIDLSAVENDKVPVMINPGRFVQDTVFYRLPKVIPGTYAVSDFGNFIENFQAYDYDGNPVAYKKIDNNSWAIYGATSLDRISYLVNDTFDVEGGDIPTPFSPTGTNIQADNYVLNLPGFIGYFDGLRENAYELEVIAPVAFDKTSALPKISEETSDDGNIISTIYHAERYFEVTDNPMMYGDLDVEEFEVGGIKVVLSVYSPNKLHSAKSLKEAMYKMMKAQKSYLGEINSTSRYDIYVYLADKTEGSPQGFGALEHHTSTVVVMPESMPPASLEKGMIDVVSHEFFHILSPLTVHSEDVHYFDYNDPTFSKHLWMYEGLTEYFANLFQVNQGLISEDEFFSKMLNKINMASRLDDTMSFTVMSENILNNPYKANYINVYQKGALIGMCLDIILREESKGERGILSVMKELSAKYGVDQPFEDDKVIDEITGMTYPSVGQFFKDHVIGTKPIDYDLYFERAGLSLQEAKVETNYIQNAGALILKGDNASQSIVFNELVTENSFWNDNGALPNDKIKEIDGVAVNLGNANAIFGEVHGWKPGREVRVVLERDGTEIVIEKSLTPTYTTGQLMKRNVDMTQDQKVLLESWLKGS